MPSITLRLEPDMWNVGYDLLATHQKNQMKLDIASKFAVDFAQQNAQQREQVSISEYTNVGIQISVHPLWNRISDVGNFTQFILECLVDAKILEDTSDTYLTGIVFTKNSAMHVDDNHVEISLRF